MKDLKKIINWHPTWCEFTEVEVESMDYNNAYPDIDNEFNQIVDKLYQKIMHIEGLKSIHEIN